MMEEVGDDTNGESTFEFVSEKLDDLTIKDNVTVSPLSTEQPSLQSPISSNTSQVPSVMSSYGQSSLSSTPGTVSNITFYNVDPKDSNSILLPPLLPPASSLDSSTPLPVQSQYLPPQPSYVLPEASGMMHIPTAQQPYYSSVDSAINLPADSSFSTTQHQQPEGGVWGWFKGKDFLNKVAEKAKNSVDSVITTLDPGMKEIINTGGDINVIVASGNEDKISAVREAFQCIFGKAIVQGIPVQSNSIAPQPVGFSAAIKAAEERISNLKQHEYVHDKQILFSIENFLEEVTPDNWFDIGCLLLQDPSSGINLQVFTTAVPVSSQFVAQAKDQTPPDYPLGWSGFAITIGQIMGSQLGVPHSQWHFALTEVSRREMLFVAAKTIAGLYKHHLQKL